jgi:hypothetical protein
LQSKIADTILEYWEAHGWWKLDDGDCDGECIITALHNLILDDRISRAEYTSGVKDLAASARMLYPGRVLGVSNDIGALITVNDWPWTSYRDMEKIVMGAVDSGEDQSPGD